MKKIYLSGPMSGIKDFNHPAFHREAARLRSLGYDVINPAEINSNTNADWHDCIRADIKALMDCDTIALMDGWQNSTGAHLEMHLAHRVKMKIVLAKEIING